MQSPALLIALSTTALLIASAHAQNGVIPANQALIDRLEKASLPEGVKAKWYIGTVGPKAADGKGLYACSFLADINNGVFTVGVHRDAEHDAPSAYFTATNRDMQNSDGKFSTRVLLDKDIPDGVLGRVRTIEDSDVYEDFERTVSIKRGAGGGYDVVVQLKGAGEHGETVTNQASCYGAVPYDANNPYHVFLGERPLFYYSWGEFLPKTSTLVGKNSAGKPCSYHSDHDNSERVRFRIEAGGRSLETSFRPRSLNAKAERSDTEQYLQAKITYSSSKGVPVVINARRYHWNAGDGRDVYLSIGDSRIACLGMKMAP
jgi:hypothetical protein